MLEKKLQLISALQAHGVDISVSHSLPSSTLNLLENKYHYLVSGGHTKTQQTDGFTKHTHTKVSTPFGDYD